MIHDQQSRVIACFSTFFTIQIVKITQEGQLINQNWTNVVFMKSFVQLGQLIVRLPELRAVNGYLRAGTADVPDTAASAN